jgi:hypothetical protein
VASSEALGSVSCEFHKASGVNIFQEAVGYRCSNEVRKKGTKRFSLFQPDFRNYHRTWRNIPYVRCPSTTLHQNTPYCHWCPLPSVFSAGECCHGALEHCLSLLNLSFDAVYTSASSHCSLDTALTHCQIKQETRNVYNNFSF